MPAKSLKPTKTIWINSQGARIPVKQMSDLHLLNVLAMLMKRAHIELADYIEVETDYYLTVMVPTYKALKAEALRRGLGARLHPSFPGL